MISKNLHLTLFTVGVFTIASALAPGARSDAQGVSATTLELSAQANVDPNKNKKPPPPKPQPHIQQQHIQQQHIQQKQINVQPKNLNVQQKQIHVQEKKQFNVQQNQQKVIQQNKQIEIKKQQNIQIEKKIVVDPKIGQKKFVGQPKVFTPKHNNVVYKFKLKNANQAFVSGKNYSVFRHDYRIRHRGAWRTFVALGVLAPLLITGAEYYPYAYMDVPGDYCSGLTEDGCELVYNEVETLEGDVIPQCVAYCPWQ